MSTIAEIEAAIRALPPADRERLADDLPSILPEFNGDAKWQRTISDARPQPALTALGDETRPSLKKISPHYRVAGCRLRPVKVKSLGTENFWKDYHTVPATTRAPSERSL